MAAPTISDRTLTNDNSNSTSTQVNYPATVDAGDLLICLYAHKSTGVGVSFPAGWTEFKELLNNTGASAGLTAGWRKADGTEDGGTFTVSHDATASRSVCYVLRIKGAADPTTTPPEVSTGVTAANQPNPDPDSLTPSGGPKDFLYIAAYSASHGAAAEATAYPSGYTYTQNTESSGLTETQSTRVAIAVASKQTTASSSDDPGTFTHGSSVSEIATFTVAVHPPSSGPQNVTGNFIAAGSALFAAVLRYVVVGAQVASTLVLSPPTTAYALTTASIASTAALFEPTVVPGAVEVTGGHVASTEATFAPTLAYQVVGASVPSSAALFEPTVVPGAVSVTAGHVASGLALFEPTVDVGPVSVTAAHLASTAAVSVPTLAYAVTTEQVASTASLFVPTATYVVVGAAIPSGAVLYEPTVSLAAGPQEVTAGHITSTATILAPSLAYVVAGAVIPSSAVISAPTLAYVVSTEHVGSTAVLYALSTSYAVIGQTVGPGSVLYEPTVSQLGGPQEVTAQHIASTLALFAPTVAVGAVEVTGAHIASAATATPPALAYVVAAASQASTAALFVPSVAHVAAGAHIVSTAVLFAPTVELSLQIVEAQHVASTAVLYGATVALAVLPPDIVAHPGESLATVISGSGLGSVISGPVITVLAPIMEEEEMALADRFPGVEYVYYGPAKAGKPAPTGPEIVLTAAQYRALFSAPQTLIPVVSGKVIIPRMVHVRKEAGPGFVYGSSTGVGLRLGTTGVIVGVTWTAALSRFNQATEEAYLHLIPTTAIGAVHSGLNLFNHNGQGTQGLPLNMYGLTADMDSGGSPVHISVLAELWPVTLV